MGNSPDYKKRKVKKNKKGASNYGYYSENEGSIDINSYSTKRSGKKRKKCRLARFWQKRKTWQRVLIIALLIIAILVSSVLIVANHYLNKIDRDDEFNKLNKEELGIENVIDEDVYNIALFGIDTRDLNGTQSNSDSIMILSLNKKENKIRLVSIMRDSLVPTEKKGEKIYAKINAAYSYGGPANAVKTINKAFGLDISEYATVNFFGMADIIDAVGGIDCHVIDDELNCKININVHIQHQCNLMGISAKPYLIKKSGFLHLNGLQAVAYARIRYAKNWQGTTNDFGRTERQRYVMQQLLDKALAMDVSSYPELVNKLAPLVKTSFNNSELISLAAFLTDKPKMETSRIPSNEYIINSDFRPYGGSTVYYNYEYAGKVLRAFLYDGITSEDYIKQNGVDKTEWFPGSSSGSKTTSKKSETSQKTSVVSDNTSKYESSTPESSEIQSSEYISSEESDAGDTESQDVLSEETQIQTE